MSAETKNFLEELIEADNASGKYRGRVATRFPPEPNGYLHIGHAKSICLNFGLAQKYGGTCNLRFDDTNPTKENTEYVEAIQHDVKWLGFEWNGSTLYASDYFEQIYQWAVKLIQDGKAYVDFTDKEEISRQRGVPSSPGIESKYRNTSPEDNLREFQNMRDGKYKEGEAVLRAKIDMTSPNMQLRDPIMYRILYAHHHRTGNNWCIYPTYDWAHGQCDSIERITHSLCTLEFEVHRPLYDWFIQNLGIYAPQQTEFARLNLNYTVMSKRKLLQLVEEGVVRGWDDPRMPTISGLRRRGFTPESLRELAHRVGVTRQNSVTDISLLEFIIREDLNKRAPRMMVVLDPLKVVVTNFEEGRTEMCEVENNPEDAEGGHRTMPFTRELWIEREDFMEEPPKGYFRFAPGQMCRLKGAYILRCDSFVKDETTGEVKELHCTYIPESRSGSDTSGLKVKGVIHWVSATQGTEVEVRLYDRLLTIEDANALEETDHWMNYINRDSLTVIPAAKAEPALAACKVGDRFQFMRKGYFHCDEDSTESRKVFNLTVGLKDTWAKEQKKG
jgi:glutaminyl-tRNA synthetase